MKKILLVFILALCSTMAFSQSRLGYSESEIRNEFWETRYNLKSNYDKSGNYYISIFTETATVFYYFDTNKDCIITFIVPDNQGALNAFVETYNTRYVIVSPTEWKMYSNAGVSQIKLVYKDNRYFFMWNVQSI